MLGLITLLLDPFAGHLLYSTGKVTLMFLASIFLIPYAAMRERGFNFFSLNAPSWSLFWEYVANVFYAIIIYRISRRSLGCLPSWQRLYFASWGNKAGASSGGWGGKTFWHGGARVAYSSLAGLLVYRSNWIIRTKLGFSALSILLLLALLVPYARGGWIREAVIIILYFPLLIAFGAGATLTPSSEKLCTFAGQISYPLYMTHYAVIWMFGNYYYTYKPDSIRLALIVTSGVLMITGVAYGVMVLYDTPVRRYLSVALRK